MKHSIATSNEAESQDLTIRPPLENWDAGHDWLSSCAMRLFSKQQAGKTRRSRLCQHKSIWKIEKRPPVYQSYGVESLKGQGFVLASCCCQGVWQGDNISLPSGGFGVLMCCLWCHKTCCLTENYGAFLNDGFDLHFIILSD